MDLNSTSIEIEENTNVSEPLANISVPDGMSVTLGSSSTPLAFKIVDDQLFLIVIPDYEVQCVCWMECAPTGHM